MPSKAQATQLPTFGAFKKFETHLQNRLPSSTKNHYREEERNSGVFLKACDESASQLNPDRDKLFSFPENNFFQKISQCKKSSPIFTFGESIVARAALEFLPGKGLCSNPHTLFSVDGTVEHPHDDYERAASLERHALSASENFQDSALEYSATAVTPPSLQNCVANPFPNFHIIGLPVW